MNWEKQNIETYDKFSIGLSEHFTANGSRIEYIERGLELANYKTRARVIELGCGDGRDAFEIIKRSARYVGIDPSKGMLDIARAKNPQGEFILSDAITYKYPEGLDVIFAFASLLHISQDNITQVFEKAKNALRLGGIFYISLKERPDYTEEIKKDEYGDRMFYLYNPELIKHFAGESFESVYEKHYKIGNTDWFNIALRKII